VLCTGDPFAVQLSRLLASLVKARRFGMTNFRVARVWILIVIGVGLSS
jgi:hypothetical protein